MTKYSPLKIGEYSRIFPNFQGAVHIFIGEYSRIFPNFQNRTCCKKYLKENKDNSLHLARKYARIFVLGHYLFLDAHSFPRATLLENCSLLGTDNVCGQISVHIFMRNAIVYLLLQFTYLLPYLFGYFLKLF